MIQKYSKGHLVSKRFIKQRGEIAIDNTLQHFRDMKRDLGIVLSNLVRLHWRIYLRIKKKKAAKKKKGAAKGKKGKKGSAPQKMMSMTMVTPSRRDSLMNASNPKNNLTKSPAVGKDSTKVSSPTNRDKKVTVTAEN